MLEVMKGYNARGSTKEDINNKVKYDWLFGVLVAVICFLALSILLDLNNIIIFATSTTIPEINNSGTEIEIPGSGNKIIYDVTADGNQSQYPYGNVADKNTSTRWANEGNSSISIDLGSQRSIEGVKIYWSKGDTRSYNFKISLSNNTRQYIDVASGDSNGISEDYIFNADNNNSVPGITRYINISVYGNTLNERASINETLPILGNNANASGGNVSSASGGNVSSASGGDRSKWNTIQYSAALAGGLSLIGFIIMLAVLPRWKKGRVPYSGFTWEGKPAVTKLTADDTYIPELIRFITLSGIALAPVLFFIYANSEFGADAPIGLVIKDSPGANGTLTGWVINVGGNKSDNFQSGIQIPFYVFVFGIAGGYLRYLYKAAFKSEHQADKLNPPLTTRQQFLWETIGELSEIVLAPFLAIAAWFLLYAAGSPNIFTVGVVSFTVGLATKDIIDRLIKYAGNAIGKSEKNKTA